MSEVSLDLADVLWLRGSFQPDPRLMDWLRAGGRIFATHEATLCLSALGLEPEPPMAFPLPAPRVADFGLAAFGSHPLFTGLREGAILVPADPSRSPYGYAGGTRPRAAGVVAVERHGLEIHPAAVLAWELGVGAGGVLCLAFDPELPAPPDTRGEAEVVLANVLVGDAIPHRDRAGPAVLWPTSGRRAAGAESQAPVLVAPSDTWPATLLPLLDLAPAADWTHAGRRALVSARGSTGRRDVWAPPFRVMHEAAIRDAIPCAPGHLAADEVAGGLAIRGHRLLERWLAAADVPVVVWEIAGPEGVEIEAEWEVDLRRGWPYPEGAYGDLEYAASSDGLSLRVEAAAGPLALYAVRNGRITTVPEIERAALRVRCRGVTPCRIVAAAGVDRSELARAVRTLDRDGVRELAATRARKAAQLQRYGTAFEGPDELLARGFAWARQRGDEALIGVPGVGRSVLASCPPGAPREAWCFGTRSCAAAAALLIAGNRDPARELLKFLAQAQHPGGGIPLSCPCGGLASAPDGPGTVAFLELAERLLAWTGENEAIRGLAVPLTRALEYLAKLGGLAPQERVLEALETVTDRAAVPAIAALRPRAPRATAVAAVEAHAIVEAATAAFRRAPGALRGTAASALLESVSALWGLEPDAPDAALGVSPALPAGWDGFALRRLRVGKSLLDLELRRRPQAIVVRIAHLFGPRLVLTVGVRGLAVASADVDDVPLPAAHARFESHDRHEVRFHLGG